MVKISSASAGQVVRLAERRRSWRPGRSPRARWPRRRTTSRPIAASPAASPLALDRLHDRVGRASTPTEHEHEQEQHQHRAGVDDDLHEGEERRALHARTWTARREHHHGEHASRSARALPDQDHASAAPTGHDGEDPEDGRPRSVGVVPDGRPRGRGHRPRPARVAHSGGARPARRPAARRHRRPDGPPGPTSGRAAAVSTPRRAGSSPSRRRRAASGAAAAPCPAAAARAAAPWSRSGRRRLSSASSYSLVMVSARVGQASMHRPHRMQRR